MIKWKNYSFAPKIYCESKKYACKQTYSHYHVCIYQRAGLASVLVGAILQVQLVIVIREIVVSPVATWKEVLMIFVSVLRETFDFDVIPIAFSQNKQKIQMS